MLMLVVERVKKIYIITHTEGDSYPTKQLPQYLIFN